MSHILTTSWSFVRVLAACVGILHLNVFCKSDTVSKGVLATHTFLSLQSRAQESR